MANVKKPWVIEPIPQAEVAELLRRATPEQKCRAFRTHKLDILDGNENPTNLLHCLKSVVEFDEAGGSAAVAYDMELAERLAAEQGRSYFEVARELSNAERVTTWELAQEIEKRTGEKSSDVMMKLHRETMRHKAKLKDPN